MDHLPKDKFYTVSEAAGYLGISVNTLKRWEEKGKILVGRTPTGIRVYKKEDLDRIKGTFEPGSQIFVQAPSSERIVSVPQKKTEPLPAQYKTVFIALFGLLVLFVTSTVILFQYSPLPHQAVLGVETFLGPVVSEEGPLGGLISKAEGIFNIFKGGSLVVPLLGKNELETPADLNVQGKAYVAKDIEGLGNLKIKGTATVGKLITGIVDPYLIENDGTVQSALEIKTQTSVLGSSDIVLEPGGIEKLRVKEGGPVTVSTNLNIGGGETIGGNLSLSSTTPIISIGDTGSLKITDGTNTLLTLSDGGTIGNLNVTGTIQGSNISEGAKVSGTNTGDQTITLTGDVTGSGTGSFATTLTTSGVTANTYGSTTAIPVLTVDSKGRITSATTAALSSSPAWSSISNPTANLSLSMAAYTTTFTYNSATSTNNLFNLTDTSSNTGTGYLMNITTASGSTLKPFHVQTTGSIDAITVLANGETGIGTNSPGSQLQVSPSSTTTIGEIIKAQASQTADLWQIQNSLAAVMAKVDNLGNLTANTLTSTVSTGTAPLTVTSTTVVPNLNAGAAQQPNPNLVLNSDFSRRNKWMTFMPETFTDINGTAPQGWTAVTGSIGTVNGTGTLTVGTVGNWGIKAGLSTWRDARFSAQVKLVDNGVGWKYQVAKYVDSSNYVSAEWSQPDGNGLFLVKVIGGVRTVVASAPVTPTVNNWYWLELESQGTTYIAKMYNCGVAACAKSSATLVSNTTTGTISDSAVAAGQIFIGTAGSNNGATPLWGGLSTGDGGVYVEGWGPESWTPTYSGTKGGQAIGFDESAGAGPISKQWALRAYIPATSREILFDQMIPSGAISDSDLSPSTTYTFSYYVKTVSTSGPLLQGVAYSYKQDGTNDTFVTLNDAQEGSWTRKTANFTTGASGIRHANRLDFNYGSNATGTVLVDLPQVEQGAIATPWRNAPADDNPITWRLYSNRNANSDITTTDTSGQTEADPRDLAANVFLPWDATVEARAEFIWTNSGLNVNYAQIAADGVSMAESGTSVAWVEDIPVATRKQLFSGALVQPYGAGKKRIAIRIGTSAGTASLYRDTARTPTLTITANKGKFALFDLAEEYSVNDLSIEQGDVISLVSGSTTTVGKTVGGYQKDILGVISSAPGITLGNYNSVDGSIVDSSPDRYRLTDHRPVALSGRVPVKVTNENGEIRRGDTLTSSDKYPGYAMRATKAGKSIGIAMEPFDSSSTSLTANGAQDGSTGSPDSVQFGKIMTFVNLSWYDPDVYLTDSGSFVINKSTSNSTVQLASNGQVATPSAIPNSQFTISNSNTKETIDRTGAFNNLFVANLKVGKLDATEISQLTQFEQRIRRLELATQSAVLSASVSGLLNESTATNSGILSSLNVSGRTILNDLGITGNISAGLLSIDGLTGSINSLGGISFKVPGGEILIDKDGNLIVSNKITAQKIEADIFSSTKASGSSVLPAGTASVDVISQNATDYAKILITPTTLTDKVLTVTSKTAGKFTVSVKAVEPQDIKFDWFIIN